LPAVVVSRFNNYRIACLLNKVLSERPISFDLVNTEIELPLRVELIVIVYFA